MTAHRFMFQARRRSEFADLKCFSAGNDYWKSSSLQRANDRLEKGNMRRVIQINPYFAPGGELGLQLASVLSNKSIDLSRESRPVLSLIAISYVFQESAILLRLISKRPPRF